MNMLIINNRRMVIISCARTSRLKPGVCCVCPICDVCQFTSPCVISSFSWGSGNFQFNLELIRIKGTSLSLPLTWSVSPLPIGYIGNYIGVDFRKLFCKLLICSYVLSTPLLLSCPAAWNMYELALC